MIALSALLCGVVVAAARAAIVSPGPRASVASTARGA